MADYPRSWNEDHPPVIRREIRIDIDRLVEGAKLLPFVLFYAYIVIAFLLQGGCIAEDPADGLDIPAGCQCAGALEELDRRLRAVETPGSGGRYTFTRCRLRIESGLLEECSHPNPEISMIYSQVVALRENLYLQITMEWWNFHPIHISVLPVQRKVYVPYPVVTARNIQIFWGENLSTPSGAGDIEVRDGIIYISAPLLEPEPEYLDDWMRTEIRDLKVEVPVPAAPIPAYVPLEEW